MRRVRPACLVERFRRLLSPPNPVMNGNTYIHELSFIHEMKVGGCELHVMTMTVIPPVVPTLVMNRNTYIYESSFIHATKVGGCELHVTTMTVFHYCPPPVSFTNVTAYRPRRQSLHFLVRVTFSRSLAR